MKAARRVCSMNVFHGRADGGAGATNADKGLGSSPFSKGLAVSKGMSLDVLRTSSRISAESEIPYAERARQGVPMSFRHLQSGGLFWQEGFCRDFP